MSVIDINHLIALRNAKGWDQKQLADAAGIDRSVISRLERSLQTDCRLSVFVAIASALETPIEYLVVSPNHQPRIESVSELDAAVVRLHQKSGKVQRQAALILNAFLEGIED